MFGSRRKGPAVTPFAHGEDCKTPDAEPEWFTEPGSGGRWQRVCSCRTEFAYPGDGALDPNSAAAEPAWSAHEHAPSCEATTVAQVVRVAKYEDGGWRSECVVCGTICLFWWDPDHRDRNDRPVRREGNILYAYETRHQLTVV
jgi:hypothetical protein